MSNKLATKNFSSRSLSVVKQPHFVDIQLSSWRWFVEQGIKELFEEFSPIKDYSGKDFELHFLDYYFDEPKYDEETTRAKELTYEAALRAKVKLINHKTNTVKEQEVYLGDFPIMASRGVFIINGVERVVVSQLIRSAGIYFTAEAVKGRKLFGAKIIPNRGSWLEFTTEPDGVISVKIDKHRRVPATDLLRIFSFPNKDYGLMNNEEILNTFSDIDNGPIKFIKKTLDKDLAKTPAESYIEIYKRLRPGDLATAENAQSLIDAMFKRTDRYSLSAVGRYKFNHRIGLKDKTSHLLDLEDLIATIREIIRLNNDPLAEPDDIDHLSNRRIRAVGELLQGRLRVGFQRMRRTVQDRMSTLDINTLLPAQLINSRLLTSVVREFLTTSQLSQFLDQTNPLSELENKRLLSSLGPGGLTRERAKFEARDVHPSYYGRICPIQTPEGQNIGLINRLSIYSKPNEFGFLITPYLKVRNGIVTDEIVWLTADEELKYSIAEGSTLVNAKGRILEDVVEARVNGEPSTCKKEKVDLIDTDPQQLVSVGTALIPFLEHNDVNRALMGSNMQKQAVPLIKPTAPLVSTGVEEKAAYDAGYLVISDCDGEVVDVDASKIIIRSEGKDRNYSLNKFKRSNQYTCINQTVLVQKGEKVKKGAVLADGPSSENGILALGQNVLVAFLPFEGANFEDAIVVSERVVRDDLFKSVHIEDFYCDVRETKLGPETTTNDIPNVSEEKLRNLDEEGIIRIGAEVEANDILVGKISPKGEVELTPEEKLLQAIFGEQAHDIKDTSLLLPHGKNGRVIRIKIFSRDRGDKLEPGVIKRIQVEVATSRNLRAGDKLSGRYGNKGVVSQIRIVEDMPYLEDGTPVDIILNPLGVISRMNLGQILETHLGLAAKKLGYRAISPIFIGAAESQIKEELKKAGFSESGKVTLYDGRTGKPFAQPITVGYMYIMKLNHLVEDKLHMRATGPYSLITQQPLGGKAQFGGQRFGEMEVWALEGYGASHTLQEMLTIKSDDVLGRSAAFEAIIRGEKIRKPNIPSVFNVMMSELRALGLSIEPIEDDENKNNLS